jgi:hypothetical protein
MTKNKKRVFVVQNAGHFNVDPAKKFGDVIFLIDEDEHVYPFDTEKLVQRFSDLLDEHDYDPELDFIAFTGPHILVALFFGIVMAYYENPKVLLYDAKTSSYNERIIRTPDKEAVHG